MSRSTRGAHWLRQWQRSAQGPLPHPLLPRAPPPGRAPGAPATGRAAARESARSWALFWRQPVVADVDLGGGLNQVALSVAQQRVPDVEYQDGAGGVRVVPRLVLDGVIEHPRLT